MKILITGSRTYKGLHRVRDFLNCLEPYDIVICGGAQRFDPVTGENTSVDHEVFLYHKEHPEAFIYNECPAAWEVHGNRAGIVRNLEMLDKMPDLVAAFWNGESRGTKFVIDAALKRHLDLRVIFDLLYG